MKFIKLPTKIALAEEIDKNDDMGMPTEWEDGFVLCNIDEIQEVVEGVGRRDVCSDITKWGE